MKREHIKSRYNKYKNDEIIINGGCMPNSTQALAGDNKLKVRYTWVVPKPLRPAINDIMSAFIDTIPAHTIRKIVTAGVKLYNELGPEGFAEYIKEQTN